MCLSETGGDGACRPSMVVRILCVLSVMCSAVCYVVCSAVCVLSVACSAVCAMWCIVLCVC